MYELVNTVTHCAAGSLGFLVGIVIRSRSILFVFMALKLYIHLQFFEALEPGVCLAALRNPVTPGNP